MSDGAKGLLPQFAAALAMDSPLKTPYRSLRPFGVALITPDCDPNHILKPEVLRISTHNFSSAEKANWQYAVG
jgi:hypothetical protein